MAVVRGEKDLDNSRTVVCVGHMDTVGISDYGNLRQFANKPYLLTEKFEKMKGQLSPECQRDLSSGDYLFGRGIFDMKAGDAIIIALLEYITADIKNFSGNVIFLAVCDEEGSSTGMLSAVSELRRMQDSGKYDLCAMVDTDYMTSEYEGDENKYVYIGTVGKLMPAFFIVGKETHVGEPFKGLDPNQISSDITSLVVLNPDFCDIAEGEASLPPVTLCQKDLKQEYSVQTSRTSLVYFNYATHCSTPDQVLKKMKAVAKQGMERTIANLQARYDRYKQIAGQPKKVLPWKARVLSFEELCAAVRRERGASFDTQLSKLLSELSQNDQMDVQQKSQKIVEFVHELWSDRDPVVIVGFFPPYYPHIHIAGTREKERKLLSAVGQAVKDTQCDYKLVWKKFFPYISDLSYAAAPQDSHVIAALKNNMPGFGVTYDLPLADMQALNLPVVDIGTFGKDAHKFTERLEKQYSFHVTPELVYRTILNLLTSP